MSLTLASFATRAARTATGDAVIGTIHAVIDRLLGVVMAETEALTRRVPIDIDAVTRQKRQGLLELTRLMRALPAVGPKQEVRARLAALAEALDRNQAALDVQLSAVRDVAEIVAKVMREAESDGTYTLRTNWQ